MLKLRTHNAGDVVAVKFFSGEEFVAKVTEVNEFGVIVKRPLALVMHQQGAQFIPWCLTAEDDQEYLITNAMAFIVPANKGVVTAYQKSTSAIVAPPSSGLIVPK